MWSRGSEAYGREGAVVAAEPPKAPKKLKGPKKSKGLKKAKVPKKPKDRPHALYRIYDNGGQLLYVGITMALQQRLGAHRQGRSWWHEVAIIEVEYLPSRQAALEAERDAIVREKPAHNVHHNATLRRTRSSKRIPVAPEITPWYLRGGEPDPPRTPWYLRPRPPGGGR